MWFQDHVAFRVSDMGAALGFYEGTIGLKRLSCQVDEEHHEAFAFLELGGGNLELLQCLDESNQPVPHTKPIVEAPYCPHLALRTDDLDGLVATLCGKGVAIVKGPLEIPGQVRFMSPIRTITSLNSFSGWRRR